MSGNCSDALSSPLAEAVVNTYGNQFFEWARASRFEASEAFNALETFTIQPVNFNASYNISQALTGFVAPPRPEDPEGLEFGVPSPLDPRPLRPGAAALIELTEAPNEPGDLSNIALPVFGPTPGALNIPEPGNGPTLSPITPPAEPVLVDPTAPVLLELDLPVWEPIVIPPFEGVRPTRDFEAPDNTFHYEEPVYSSELLDTVKARLLLMSQGGTGLPAVIEQAIYDRGADRQARDMFRAIQEVYHEVASRGFDRPNGVTEERVAEVRQQGANRRVEMNRDLQINAANIEIENLRNCIAQTIALETVTIGLHNAIADRMLRVEEITIRVAVDILNARIALFNADQMAYQTDAVVYRELINGENLKLEAIKTQLEGEKIKAEINRDLVAIFETQYRIQTARVEQYRALIEAKRVESELNSQLIEQYSAQVRAYAERVRAKGIEWEGYNSRVRAEEIKQRVTEIRAGVWATRMQAWAEGNRTELAKGDFYLREFEADVRSWLGDMERFRAELDAERSRIESITRVFDGQARVYAASASVEESKQQSNQRAFSLHMEQERTKKELDLRGAEVNIQQGIEIGRIILGKLESLARNQTQLAASSMAGLNIGAQISASEQKECQTSYSFSGSIV